MNDLISVIVSTYNWPTALDLVLQSLALQKDNHFEVIVADDGSKAETAELISHHQAAFPHPLIHSWQETRGFAWHAPETKRSPSRTGTTSSSWTATVSFAKNS